MKQLMIASTLVCVIMTAPHVARSEGETAKWTAGNGAWEAPENWDLGVVPGSTMNVRFNASGSTPTVSVSSELGSIRSMFVTGKGVNFNLGANATMTVTDVITNYNSVTYSGGSYSFGGDLLVGRSNAWPGGTVSYSTTATFNKAAVAEIAGKVWVTGYSGNGLRVSGDAKVKCAGFQNAGGTRNATEIGKGLFHSTGNITICDSWPADNFLCPFTVNGGTVTNEGSLVIAEKNAGSTPLISKNNAKWRQYGLTTVANVGNGNSLQILSGSKFESSSDIIISAATKQMRNRLIVADNSSLTANNLTVGNANYQTNLWVSVANGSSIALSGTIYLGNMWAAKDMSLAVTDNSSFSSKGFVCGNGGFSDNLTIAVTNSSFMVANSADLPYDTSDKDCNLTFVGTAENPATASFPNGVVLGAGAIRYTDSTRTSAFMRSRPTTLLLDNAVLTSGSVVSGTSSGDTRLGKNDVAGVYDLATNRIIIAGAKGCLESRHRFMTAGNAVFELRVPKGGYQNEFGCALHLKNAYLTNASFLIDLSEVDRDTEWREYLLADSTVDGAGGLYIDTSKITVVAPKPCRYQVVYTQKKTLSIRVKLKKGFALIVR